MANQENRKIAHPFMQRYREGAILSNGKRAYEETFFINRQPPLPAEGQLLRLFAYGESLWHKGYQIKRAVLSNWWSFEFITDGDMEISSNGVRYRPKPGDVLILRPRKMIHQRPGPSGLIRKRCLLIEGALLDSICNSGVLAGVEYLQAGMNDRLISILDNIYALVKSTHPNCQQDAGVEVYAILSELCQVSSPQRYPAALQKALDLIHARLADDHSIKSLSAAAYVSPSTLSRLFQKHLHTGPVKYLIERRLEQAKLLLKLNTLSLKEIAQECGYKSESFFSRAFKQKYGLAPAHYRRGSI